MKNKPTLALVMIVKNEELGLERAIKSCISFVDEIVIAVDNSSVDKTEVIADKYATTLKHFDWRDDFAWARNFAHEGVLSDWILFLDGHEFVEKSDLLVEYLKKDCDSLLCTVELDSGSSIRNPRIYKNGLKFVGAVHEVQNCKHTILYPQFLIKHNRIGGQSIFAIKDRENQRDDQIPRIMGNQLKLDQSNTRASFHLALHAQSKGNFNNAYKYQDIYLKHSKLPCERWFVYFNRALCFLAQKRLWRAFWAVNQANNEVIGRWEISKLKGLIFFEKGDYIKAITAFIDSFKINEVDEYYKPWKRDEAGTWNMIGESFYRLGEFWKASISFDRAFDISTDDIFKELTKKRANLMRNISEKVGK